MRRALLSLCVLISALPLAAKPAVAPATGDEIRAACEQTAVASPRVILREYGESHENRSLFYLIVSDPSNLGSLESDGAARTALPESGRAAIGDLPAVVWIGAGVHGNEASGSDAVLQVLRELAEGEDAVTQEILSSCIVLLDPLQNPDGRARFLENRRVWRGKVPDRDSQSLNHRHPWPSGRGNHYWLDLNRDWLALTQPESRARARVFLQWQPQVSFDLHEMRGFDSYLFSPPRPPFNSHLPASTHGWWHRFSIAQARDFGSRSWSCYTGDWNEEFSPNRGASWPLYLGTVALLGEQASTGGSCLDLPEGLTRCYEEAVAHHRQAVMSLLISVAAGRADLLADWADSRRCFPATGDHRLLVIEESAGSGRARRLADLLIAQGGHVTRADTAFSLPAAVSYWKERRGERPFAAGSYLVSLARGEGRLISAVTDFDPEVDAGFLAAERTSLQGGAESLLYESSAWSLAMAAAVDVWRSDEEAPVSSTPLAGAQAGLLLRAHAPYGFLLAADQPGAAEALAALHRSGMKCWGAGEGFTVGDRRFPPGSVLLRRGENSIDLPGRLQTIAAETGASFFGVDHALTVEGPDLGSRRFRYLPEPQVALLAGSPFYQTSTGAIWHLLDAQLGLGCSLLRPSAIDGFDLDRYRVLIVPDASPGKGPQIAQLFGEEGMVALLSWVQRGGTLITTGEGNGLLFDAELPRSGLRRLRQLLPPDDLLADQAARRFSPRGVILRADLDARHWLCGGVGSRVPVFVKTDMVLRATGEASARGAFAGADSLRLSGILWPEAAARLAGSAYLVTEQSGRGQIISFLGNPAYRGSFRGTSRLLANAVLLGPGMGTAKRVRR